MSPLCGVQFPDGIQPLPFEAKAVEWARDIVSSDITNATSGEEDDQVAFLPNLTIAIKDGNARLSVLPQASVRFRLSKPKSQYRPHFRIPPAKLASLDKEQDRMTRARDFALGCLLFQLVAGKEPFADLDNSRAQENFQNGIYPPETMQLPLDIFTHILCLWSHEFARAFAEWAKASATPDEKRGDESGDDSDDDSGGNPGGSPDDDPDIFGGIKRFVKDKPVTSCVVAGGIAVFGAASLVVPVLGAVGFTALGPAASTTAAAWQSSIGLVQAGSFFAWCQSAAMGGAAAGTIVGAQGTGLGIAAAALLKGLRGGDEGERAVKAMLWDLFVQIVTTR